MEKAKKTEVITFRTDTETKKTIEAIAERNKWSTSQVVEELLKEYLSKNKERATSEEKGIFIVQNNSVLLNP